MNILNVILFTTMPPTLQAINLPATAMLGIVMSSRLVLNIRTKATDVSDDDMSAMKTTQFNTGMPLGYSGTSTAATAYQTHDCTSQDLESGTKSAEKVVITTSKDSQSTEKVIMAYNGVN